LGVQEPNRGRTQGSKIGARTPRDIAREYYSSVMRENLWDRPGVPHRGWRCVAVEDTGEATHTCEMCGREEIRHVHTLVHDAFATPLDVGCVCAEKLEEGPAGASRSGGAPTPREREASLRGRAAKRKKWLTRRWRASSKGGFFLRSQGLVIVVKQYEDGRWKASAKYPDDRWVYARGSYDVLPAAQLAIFDVLWPARVSLG
jgi:hypothetical protein